MNGDVSISMEPVIKLHSIMKKHACLDIHIPEIYRATYGCLLISFVYHIEANSNMNMITMYASIEFCGLQSVGSMVVY